MVILCGTDLLYMPKLIDISSQKFHRLTVLSHIYGTAFWICKCDCGKEVKCASSALRFGRFKSCGCLSRERTAERMRKHGMYKTQEFRAWRSAKSRCFNKNSPRWGDYGGRGISMCQEWVKDFAAFFNHIGVKPPNTSLDRIDVNGHYEPGNVRWATRQMQDSNRRCSRIIEAFGVVKTLQEWHFLTGLSCNAISSRIAKGWAPEDAMLTPSKMSKRGFIGKVEKPSQAIVQLAESYGFPYKLNTPSTISPIILPEASTTLPCASIVAD